MVEVWQVVALCVDGTEIVLGLHLDEADADRQCTELQQAGEPVSVIHAEMGECGCGG